MNPSNANEIISGWMVARRYSEFHALHQKLKSKFPVVEAFGFPGKSVRNMFRDTPEFVEQRRISLEIYIRQLSLNVNICQCKEFRIFMCQQNVSMLELDDMESFSASASPNAIMSKKRSSNFVQSMRERSMFDEVMEKLSDNLPNARGNPDSKSPMKLNVDGAGGLGVGVGAVNPSSSLSSVRNSFVKETFAPDLMEQLGDALAENEILMGTAPVEVATEELALPISKTVNEPLIDLFIEIFDLKVTFQSQLILLEFKSDFRSAIIGLEGEPSR